MQISLEGCKLSCRERKPVALSELQLLSRHLPVGVPISTRRLPDLVIQSTRWHGWCRCIVNQQPCCHCHIGQFGLKQFYCTREQAF